MTEPYPQVEHKSSVKIATTAKGDATVQVTVYDGAEQPEVERIRQLAIDTYNATVQAVR